MQIQLLLGLASRDIQHHSKQADGRLVEVLNIT